LVSPLLQCVEGWTGTPGPFLPCWSIRFMMLNGLLGTRHNSIESIQDSYTLQ
jgi:hypothetical protein